MAGTKHIFMKANLTALNLKPSVWSPSSHSEISDFLRSLKGILEKNELHSGIVHLHSLSFTHCQVPIVLVICSSNITAFDHFLSFLLLFLPYPWVHITDQGFKLSQSLHKQLILDSSSLCNLLPYVPSFLGPVISFSTRLPELLFIICPLVLFLCLPNPSQPEFVFHSQPIHKSFSTLISSTTTTFDNFIPNVLESLLKFQKDVISIHTDSQEYWIPADNYRVLYLHR